MARLLCEHQWLTPGEQRAAEYFKNKLPQHWLIVAGRDLVHPSGAVCELDFIVVGEHTVFVVEEKSWRGRIHGDDRFWVLPTGESRPSPITQAERGARMLAGRLRHSVPLLRQTIGQQHFVYAVVVLSSRDVDVRVADSRRSERVWNLEGCEAEFRRVDTKAAERGDSIGASRKQIVEYLTRLPHRPKVPKRINAYKITGKLEANGPFRTLLAEHDDGSKRVLRLLPVSGAASFDVAVHREALLREYETLKKLEQIGLDVAPRVDPYFEWEDGQFLVVPIHVLPGRTLRADRTAAEPQSGRLLDVFLAAFEALARLHGQGVIHRSLNPDCIWLDGQGRIRFSDFLVSRLPDAETIAADADTLAPPDPYRAPECRVDPGLAEPTSDVYSLAASLLFWASGSEPQADEELPDWQQELRDRVTQAEYEAVKLLYQCLCEDERDRPTAKDVQEELSRLQTPKLPRAPGGLYQPGEWIDDQHRIVRLLGSGATADTYLADDTAAREHVVLKRLKDPSFYERLAQRELQSARKLDHPALRKVRDIRPWNSPFHLKMDYVHGSSLDTISDGWRKQADRCRRLLEQLLDALRYLEGKSLLHRDIKPQNIIVDEERDDAVCLIDLGLAVSREQAETAVGTPKYRPPEVDRGGDWHPSADRYSLAVVVFELLYGKLPFQTKGDQICKDRLIELEELPEEDRPLVKVLLRAVDPDPTRRYASAEEMLKALRSEIARPRPRTEEAQVNPFVDELRRAFRNSRLGNVENRGLDSDFARTTYVPTGLDEELGPAICEGRHRLVLLCGNPGDGKTAFLQRLAGELRARGATFDRDDEWGWRCQLKQATKAAVYDASESHAGRSADELLNEVLAPLAGDRLPVAKYCAIVAINDGRLFDFFERFGDHRYPALWRAIRAQLSKPNPGSPVRVVDLKRRGVVSADPKQRSLSGAMAGAGAVEGVRALWRADSLSHQVQRGQPERR